MTPQDRIERSKARAEIYRRVIRFLLHENPTTNALELQATLFITEEIKKKRRFYTDQAKQMESMG